MIFEELGYKIFPQLKKKLYWERVLFLFFSRVYKTFKESEEHWTNETSEETGKYLEKNLQDKE